MQKLISYTKLIRKNINKRDVIYELTPKALQKAFNTF